MIAKANKSHSRILAEMAAKVWENDDIEELTVEFDEFATDPNMVSFIYYADETEVGFANCALRFDYVEGCETRPVGYLEGIYVDPNHQKQGIAKALVKACEDWASEMGCTEFASDCELKYIDSLDFHLAVGFEETNRIICFKKEI